MEQGTGVEPAFTAWEAVVLPIYEPCIGVIIANPIVKFKDNLQYFKFQFIAQFEMMLRTNTSLFEGGGLPQGKRSGVPKLCCCIFFFSTLPQSRLLS